MVTACLGIDVSKLRLGLALVTFEAPTRPLWLATRAIFRRDGGWQESQIKDALRSVPVRLGQAGALPMKVTAFGPEPHPWGLIEITRIAIEKPALPFPGPAFEAGGVYALTLAACHRIWPWAPQVPVQPSALKKAVTGKGNASKAEVADWARGELARWGVPEPAWSKEEPAQDAYDALAAAYAGVGVKLGERVA